MKLYCLSLIGCLVLTATVSASAQDTTSAARLDSLFTEQKTPEKVLSNEPLADKTFGVEFNPLRLILGWTTDVIGRYTHLVGGFSLFALDRRAEIAFPVYYVFGTYDGIPWRILNVDVTYRRFLADQSGFYFSGGFRYAYVTGEEYLLEGSNPVRSVSTGEQIVQSKFGAYAGIGYRYFLPSGFYFGTSLTYGRYFSNDRRYIVDMKIDDRPFILDFDLLKIGYAF